MPVVYVKYLESAPWNVKAFSPVPKYGGIGTRLLEAAARLSVAQGFRGRVGLHSLPNALTQNFYRQRRLISFGPDADVEDLPYYELSEAAAIAFFQQGKDYA
jgi:hypothetical protein